MASNARTNCSFGSRAAPSRITFDTDVSDKWHFPVFLVGEFGQGRAASLHFVSEWANCGPLACLAAAWISATDAALRQAAAALSPQHGPTTTPLHCPAMPVMVLPSATPPTSDSATIPTPSSGLAPVAAPAVSPSPSPCLPLRLGGVMVSQAVTAITTVSPSVHALCKEVLNRAFKCRGGVVIYLPEQGCSFLNHRVTIKDGFARGESRHIELVVVYRDHDALAACAKTILRRLDRVANDLQAEAKETLLREASIHGEATLVAHRAMHSYDMRPLRDVVFRGSSGAGSSSFDDYLFAQSKKILGSFPLGPSDAKLLVTRALTIRPQLVGLVGCTSTGCTAMQPTLVLNATSPARLSLTQQSIATPPTMATGVTHTPCSASKKPLFPDAPMEIDTASTSVTRSSNGPQRFHTLSAWLSGTYQRSRSTYLEAVLWPLTLLLVNDGETPEGRVHVLPQSGATMHDVVAFQRSAEAVFGRIAWAVPPAPPSAVAAALPHVSPMPQAIDAQSDLSNTIYVHGGNGDTSVPHSISAGTGAETYGTDVPVSTFARLMAARCMFTEPDANTEREANESLKSDVEAARCASANYAISVLAKRVFLPIGERTYHRSRPAAKPESTSVFKRIVNFVANSKEKEEKEKLKQDIETKNGQREAASTALRTATLAVALNAFNALDTPQFSRGNSCSTLSPAMSSLSRDPSATLVSMSRDDSIAVGLDRQYKAKIEDELTPDLVALLKAGIAVPQDASNAVVRMEHKVCFCIARHLRRITVD